jgi:hypothetical protein
VSALHKLLFVFFQKQEICARMAHWAEQDRLKREEVRLQVYFSVYIGILLLLHEMTVTGNRTDIKRKMS